MEEYQLKEQARAKARQVLAHSQSFKAMPMEEQRALYQDVVQSEYNNLLQQHGYRTGNQELAVSQRVLNQDVTDFDYGKGYEDSIEGFERLVDSVDFPKFVADLLKSVFDANIDVMRAQTDDFIRLMKEATKSVSDFVTEIDETAAFGYLAENEPKRFTLRTKRDGDKNEVELADPEGEPMDMDDNEVKAKIMEAKIAMAQEHRAMIREILLMGVTRLTVEKGKVKASVLFDFAATREVTRDVTDTRERQGGGGVSGCLNLGFFRIGGGGRGKSSRVTVSSANSIANDEMRAKLSGDVEINFKTDYFKLDNFANMYAVAPNSAGVLQGQRIQQGQQGQIPPNNPI